MKISKDEKGFSAVEVVLVLVIVVLIGVVGWLVYKDHHKTTTAVLTSAPNRATETRVSPPISSTTPNTYAGWSSCNNPSESLSIKYPSTWSVTGVNTNGSCPSSGQSLVIWSPQTSAAPYFFKISYTSPSPSDGVIDGDSGTEAILSVSPLNVQNSKVPLYVVAFNGPGSVNPNDVFELAVTDQDYTVGQTVDHVKVAASQKINGDYYYLTANMVASQDQQYLGSYTLAQYQAQPDYNTVIKIFQSLSY